MTEEKDGQESKTNPVEIDLKVAKDIVNILSAPIIDYTEWHRNRDNLARHIRNNITHKKYLEE